MTKVTNELKTTLSLKNILNEWLKYTIEIYKTDRTLEWVLWFIDSNIVENVFGLDNKYDIEIYLYWMRLWNINRRLTD